MPQWFYLTSRRSVLASCVLVKMVLTLEEQKELDRLLEKAKIPQFDAHKHVYDPDSGMARDKATGYTFLVWDMDIPKSGPGDHASGDTPVPSTSVPAIPPGVRDLKQWGQTVINFGQYKGSMTYGELIKSTNEREVKYVKWLKARAGSATGQHKDMTNFIERFQQEEHGGPAPLIPGTSQPREFRE